MPRTIQAGCGLDGIRDAGEPARAAFRISEPDGEGNCFIIAPRSNGREDRRAADETGRFAREGA
jgi:hypothetical protein